MPNYNLPLSPEQDALVQWLTANYNTEHDSTLTPQQFIGLQLGNVLAPYAETYKASVLRNLDSSFSKADAATQAQIKTLLKLP